MCYLRCLNSEHIARAPVLASNVPSRNMLEKQGVNVALDLHLHDRDVAYARRPLGYVVNRLNAGCFFVAIRRQPVT